MVGAAEFYESQSRGLGLAYLGEVQSAISRITQNPRSGGLIRGEIRCRFLRRFPFSVLYRIDPEEIVIIAIMHLRRRPGYWENRIV
ncbi:MAG: type II toxin-antitoxin system RelE/ParE family toxin [Chloroflexi bacterium]|nr:type II toxin-antitoxin system RelE/ParE family toxin [Chloroflexota bacterium]